VKTAIQAAGLVAVGAAAVLERTFGAAYPLVPPKAVIALGAAVYLVLRRNQQGPTVGVAVAGFLAAGAVVMPNVADQLRAPARSGLFYSTVAELVAIAIALAAGALQLRSRNAPSAAAPFRDEQRREPS
jgi:hypothetical protein